MNEKEMLVHALQILLKAVDAYGEQHTSETYGGLVNAYVEAQSILDKVTYE